MLFSANFGTILEKMRGREATCYFAAASTFRVAEKVLTCSLRAPVKRSLDNCHPHFGLNRVGNETILMGGMMHLIELFRTGLSVVAPRNLWA